jgi:DNA processing protein
VSEDVAYYWYRLLRAKGIGPRRMRSLYAAVCAGLVRVEDLFGTPPPSARTIGWTEGALLRLRQNDAQTTLDEYQEMTTGGCRAVYPGHVHYPERLLACTHTAVPVVFLAKGATALLLSPSVAIVGMRRATHEGVAIARERAAQLAEAGYNVVAGHARGVDISAHAAALQYGGTTTLVLSHGLLQFVPDRALVGFDWNGKVLAVSQFAPREKWTPGCAMARNRLICALASVVVVVASGVETDEQGRHSGSFATGTDVLRMGIPLLVVAPDAYADPPPGNEELIRAGGRPIHTEDSIVEAVVNAEAASAVPTAGTQSPQLAFQIETTTGG